MRKKSDIVEQKLVMSLVNLLPKVRPASASDTTGLRDAELLLARAARIIGATNTAGSQPSRQTARAKTSGAPTITLQLGGRTFAFSPARHLHPSGHAILFHSFLTHCRGTLLALASKSLQANAVRLDQYYPATVEEPRSDSPSLTSMMPTGRTSELRPSFICVPAPGIRTVRVDVDGTIQLGNDPYHDGFMVLLLRCDARRIRVCEVCHVLFYARTLNQRGCDDARHRNLVSQRVKRAREKEGRYNPSRRLRAAIKVKQKSKREIKREIKREPRDR